MNISDNTSPLVSVVIPVYNSGLYVDACLQSVLRQTYPFLEIIVVNDGSIDDSLSIIRRYEQSDKRVFCIDKLNEGLPLARKTGVEHAHGKYIQHLDSDDTLLETAIEQLVNRAEATGADIVAAPFYFCGQGQPARLSVALEFDVLSGFDYFCEILHERAYWSVWSNFQKRSLFQVHTIQFVPDISFGEDAILMTQLLFYANKVASLSVPILHYNRYPTAMSLQVNTTRYREFRAHQVWIEEFLKKKGIYTRVEKEMAAIHLKTTFLSISWRRLEDVRQDMSRAIVSLQRFPELEKTLTERERKLIACYRISSWWGKLNLKNYCREKNKLKCKYYNSLLKRKLFVSPKILVQLDGGICSQMHQFLLGQLFARRGFEVRYDLNFYREWGSDLDCQFVRNFDLLKAFPYLNFREASALSVEVYKSRYYFTGNNTGERIDDFSFLQKTPPLYLGGYYHLPSTMWLETFRSLFRISLEVLDEQNRRWCEEISRHENSVAVHVRRGDLKKEVFAYGKPASVTYFQHAVDLLMHKFPGACFYFFSDEPDWVGQSLLPMLPAEGNYQVVDINGSDRGYMDLFLIAHCKHQITSKGTLGKYGAILGNIPGKVVVLCDDETEYVWKEYFETPIFV